MDDYLVFEGEMLFTDLDLKYDICILDLCSLNPFLARMLSRKDIQIIARCGCPSLDRKVVNSGKRLRAYVGVDEGDVCAYF